MLAPSLVAVEFQDTASAIISDFASLSLAAADSPDVTAITTALVASATLAATDTQDTANASAQSMTLAALAATEAQDIVACNVNDFAALILFAGETTDTVSATTAVVAAISLAITEAQDTAGFSSNAVTNASLGTTEPQDAALFSANNFAFMSFAVTENVDSVSAQTALVATTSFALTETQDTAVTAVYVLWGVVPELQTTWTAQFAPDAYWQEIAQEAPASNSSSIGPVAGAPIGAAPIASLAPGGPTANVAATWTPQSAGIVFWQYLDPAAPTPTSKNVGAIAAEAVGSLPVGASSENVPTPNPASPAWQNVPQTYDPVSFQQAA